MEQLKCTVDSKYLKKRKELITRHFLKYLYIIFFSFSSNQRILFIPNLFLLITK